jgi:signal transduction histidine kinase
MNTTPLTPLVSSTIMIVDDEPDNLNVLEAALSRAGYRVSVFPRGELALAAAQIEPPDLVLLDIRMKGMDGYEVCRRLKDDERLRAIPVLFISALSSGEDVAAGFACGGVDYVAKPFREAEVLARVGTHIALRGAYLKLAGHHEQLKSLEKHRDTLVHMLVHDMRSPLHVILGQLEMVVEDEQNKLKTENVDSLHAAIHGARVLERMVSVMIDLSRIESGKMPMYRVSASLHELFYDARGQSLDPSSRHRITESIASHCPHVLCDIDLSVRIIANLLSNALKYAPCESEIALGAAPDPAGVRIWVRDTGPGVAAQFHARIFEKFGVVEQPAGGRLPSTGLGLAFCKQVVEAQGGTIGIESEPGSGSTFWFTLPAAGK